MLPSGEPGFQYPAGEPAQRFRGPVASPVAAAAPTIVGVTTGCALVTLNPTTGVTEQTLVPSYVAATPRTGTLYVSEGGATPRELTTGIVAAAWT